MKCRKIVKIIWLVIPKLSKQILGTKNWSKHIILKKETKKLAKKVCAQKIILNLKPLRMLTSFFNNVGFFCF